MNYRRKIKFTLLVVCLMFTAISCGLRPSISSNQNTTAEVGQIVFGENYEEVADVTTNNGRPFKIINSHKTFRSDDPFAFIVMSEEPYGKTKIDLMLSEISDKGSEEVIFRNTLDVANPAKNKNTANRFEKAEDLLAGQKSGKYKLRCFRNEMLLAEGEFVYQSRDTNDVR